jgi:hypothetical protein
VISLGPSPEISLDQPAVYRAERWLFGGVRVPVNRTSAAFWAMYVPHTRFGTSPGGYPDD